MSSVISFLKSNKNEYLTSVKKNEQKDLADKKVIGLFKKTSRRVPAYRDFLRKNKIKAENINNMKDFKKYVPFTTKENYILVYDLRDRCWEGKVTNIHTFASSSGSTGEPIFWPREIDQEIEGARIHELLLDKVFDVYKKKTLFINSFGLGNWIAGMYTEMCLYLLRLHKVPFTLASPGYNQEETFKVVKAFSKYYDQTIIACHPPILKIMIEAGREEEINWHELGVKFFGAGEGFSENWRDYLLSLVGQKDVLSTIINIYGSADAGLMGFETPVSIALHREMSLNHRLSEKLFNSDRTPFLYQFDPSMKYLEEGGDGEILASMNAAAPLVRYNIHDKGGTLSNSELINGTDPFSRNLLSILRKHKVDVRDWPFPFVYIFGREQFMMTLYGVNIYPENIKAALEHKYLQPFLTGRFSTEKALDERQNQHLLLRVELKPQVLVNEEVKNLTNKIFVETLKKLNGEYNQVEQRYKEKMHPRVSFYPFQDQTYFSEGKIKKMA